MSQILNKKQTKEIENLLEKQFGISFDLGKNYLIIKTRKERLYLVSKKFAEIKINFPLERTGLYFAEIKNNEIRLTLEGSQLVGHLAKKNILELKKEEVEKYFLGNDLEIDLEREDNPFLILKYQNDFLGAAKYKNKKLINFLPKYYRKKELII